MIYRTPGKYVSNDLGVSNVRDLLRRKVFHVLNYDYPTCTILLFAYLLHKSNSLLFKDSSIIFKHLFSSL